MLGGALPNLKVLVNIRGIDHHFSIFWSCLGPFYAQLNLTGPCRKKWFVSITYSSRLNGGLIFHQNLAFDHFEEFYTNFLFDFRSCWPTFSLFLDLLTPHFYKTLDLIESNFFIAYWTSLQNIWWSTHPLVML